MSEPRQLTEREWAIADIIRFEIGSVPIPPETFLTNRRELEAIASAALDRGRKEGKTEGAAKERERMLAAVTALWGEDHAKQLADSMAYLDRRREGA
jgi:hypothetical protein